MMKLELAATETIWQRIARLRHRNTDCLAPRFRAAVEAAVAECRAMGIVELPVTDEHGDAVCLPLDVMVHETLRTDQLQYIYFEQGTTKAKTAKKSWHFYCLAVDVISAHFEWFTGAEAKKRWADKDLRARVASAWFKAVADVFKKHGCAWGGDWKDADLPHFQWAKCKATPDDAPAIYARSGTHGVWRAVGAV